MMANQGAHKFNGNRIVTCCLKANQARWTLTKWAAADFRSKADKTRLLAGSPVAAAAFVSLCSVGAPFDWCREKTVE